MVRSELPGVNLLGVRGCGSGVTAHRRPKPLSLYSQLARDSACSHEPGRV